MVAASLTAAPGHGWLRFHSSTSLACVLPLSDLGGCESTFPSQLRANAEFYFYASSAPLTVPLSYLATRKPNLTSPVNKSVRHFLPSPSPLKPTGLTLLL